MIRVAARSVHAVPIAAVAVVLAMVGSLYTDLVLSVPLIPAGLPATWLVAIGGANLYAVAVRPAWGTLSLTLVRNPGAQAAQLMFAVLVGVAPYLPVAIAEPHQPQTTAWLLLLAASAISVAMAPRVAFLPITLVGVGISVFNGVTMDSWYFWMLDHEPTLRVLTIAATTVAVAGTAWRMSRISWYRA